MSLNEDHLLVDGVLRARDHARCEFVQALYYCLVLGASEGVRWTGLESAFGALEVLKDLRHVFGAAIGYSPLEFRGVEFDGLLFPVRSSLGHWRIDFIAVII
jgi:hypothetical protein